MNWEIEYTDEFEEWRDTLSAEEQESIAVSVGLLETLGPNLPCPHSDTVRIKISQYERVAILLIGGNKSGDKNWYKTNIPIADRLFAQHLKEFNK